MQRIWTGFLLLMAMVVAAHAEGASLRIATTEYTSNWNPIAFETYPALLATRFTTERLYEKRCAGRNTLQDAAFLAVCQEDTDLEPGTVSLQLQASPWCPTPPHRPLTVEDIRYTVEQIRSVPHNAYYTYQLEVNLQGPVPKLLVQNPQVAEAWIVKNASSFPIVRASDGGPLYEQPLTSGGQAAHAKVTAGHFVMDKIAADEATLVLRTPSPDAPPEQIERIQITYYDLIDEVTQAMTGSNPPDVVLAATQMLTVSPDRYVYKETPELNSFTYVGFNFRTEDAAQRALIHDREFRRLFTEVLWTVDTMDDKLNVGGNLQAPGKFLGESFDPGTDASVDIASLEDLRQQIAAYLRHKKLDTTVQFDVAMSPAIEQIFDDEDQKDIYQQLNEMWQPEQGSGLQFKFFRATAGAKAFRHRKETGNFHLIFDTFFYGRNRLKYMAFCNRSPIKQGLPCGY